MGKLITESFCMMQNIRMIIQLGILSIILLGSVAESHTIHRRHDIIESAPSNEKVNLPAVNETSFSQENESPMIDYAMTEEVDDVQNPKDGTYSVETNNVQDKPVSSTTDVNNGIEQNFGNHSNSTTAIETINASNSQTNFTKDISQQESVENRLPSKTSDRPSSRGPAIVTTASLMGTTKSAANQETHSSASIPLVSSINAAEKPKRLDASFVRSTERAVPVLDTSTIPVSRSTVSILSTHPVTPKVSASETIRARISSIPPELAEKRAKFLSDSHIGSSSPSSINKPEASWSDLRTVGEVQNNHAVAVGKSLPQEESLSSVNGKIDSEEIEEKGSAEASSTEKIVEEHETQLQKSNSSRIADVQEDNSLSSFPSSSHRPTIPVTKKAGHTKPSDEFHQDIRKMPAKGTDLTKTKEVHTNLEENVPKITESVSTAAVSSTERVKNEETTMNTVEDDVVTTTEEDQYTTVVMDETTTDETTTLGQVEVTKLAKTRENLVALETTTITPTTDESVIPTTMLVITTKGEENQIQQQPTQGQIPEETTNATEPIRTSSITTPSLHTETDSTTQEVTKPLTRPTKPVVQKPTQLKERIISKDEAKAPEQPSSTSTSTIQQMVPDKIPSASHPTSNESTESTPTTHFVNVAAITEPMLRKVPESHSTASGEHQTEIAPVPENEPTDINAMIAIGISVVAVVSLILLVGFLYVMRKRQKQLTYSQRCRPIGLDAYSLDNISIYNSVRRKSAIRSSKRAFGNAGFDDPGLKNNPLSISQLATFSQKRVSINEEFREIPTVTARIEEVPIGCEDKNRYANVVPLPESRVHLTQLDDDEKTEYINANFVKGPKDTTHYYIACQAPLEHTVIDFWRMIWEQNSRCIIMATDLTENGIEKCAEYLPSSFVIDNHVSFGDYQITLKNREVRDKYAVSTVHLKNACTKTWREITHFWYQWPENGVPTDEASVIAMLLEARSYLKMVTPEQSAENGTQESNSDGKVGNGNLDKTKSLQRIQGPLTVHCSPGTGRTGTIIGCDIAIRSLEQPMRSVDVPQIVYFVRRGRASAVQTREQYEFIYKVAHVYATKLTGPSTDN